MDEIKRNILLGLIIGDALGSSFDGLGRGHIRSHFKEIDDYVDPSPALKGKLDRWKKPGFYSSISQFAILAAAGGKKASLTATSSRYAEGSRDLDEHSYGIFRYPDGVEKRFIARMKKFQEGSDFPEQPSVRVVVASIVLSFKNFSPLDLAGNVISYTRQFTHDVPTAAGAASLAWLLRFLMAESPLEADFVRICLACNEMLIEAVNSDPAAIFGRGLNPDALIHEINGMNEILSRIISVRNGPESEAVICECMNARLKTPITRATVNMPLALIPLALAISTVHRDDPNALFVTAMEGGAAAALTALSAAVRVAAYGPVILPVRLVRNLSNRKRIIAIVDSVKDGIIPESAMENFIQTEAALTRKELEELKAKQKHTKKKPKEKLTRTEKETRLSHYVVESWTKIDKAKWKKERKKIDKKQQA
jgi:hypothetical protein